MKKYLNRINAQERSGHGSLRPAGWLVMVFFVGPLSLSSFGAPSGIEWELRPFGSSSLISNSVAMTWDDRARLWVLETQGAGELARSRLLILSDESGDGSKISTKIFADELPRSTGFEWSPQGVVLGSPPQLLLLQDTKRDDRVDQRQVLWQGLGFPAERAALTDFVWGPDNGLYCLFQTPNTVKVGARGVSTNEWTRLNPGVLRFELKSRTLEVFAEGPAKPSGLDFDAEGNLFVASAARESLYHLVEGSTCLPRDHFPRPMDASATLVPPINDRTLSRFGSGGLLAVPAGALPALFSSQFFLGGTNPISFQPVAMRSRGASFRATAGAGDRSVPSFGGRSDRALWGPDGNVWLRSSHRIARLAARDGLNLNASRSTGVAGWSNDELVGGLQRSNRWLRRMAQRALVDRADPASFPRLVQLLESPSPSETRRICLWTLAGIRSANHEWLNRAAQNGDPVLKSWALRLLARLLPESPEMLRILSRQAESPDPRVRLQVALAVRRLEIGGLFQDGTARAGGEVGAYLSVLDPLLKASAAEDDPWVGGSLWSAVEPSLIRDPQAVLEWLRRSGDQAMPLSGDLLSRSIRHNFGTHDPKLVEMSLKFLLELADQSPTLCTLGLEGMMLGQKGSKMWSGHKGVKRLLTHLAESGNQELSRSAEQVDALCGNPRAQAVILSRITDPQLSEGERVKSILFTRVLPSDAARSALLDVMSATNSSALSFPALSALEEVGRPESAVELIHRWNTLSDTLKPAVIESLASRVDWAAALVSGLESRKVSATELSETALALLRTHSNPALQARLKLALQQPVRR